MSTIKSSTDHLTLNADGASKDIKFQANGVEKASISSAGAFTSTTIDATKLTGNLPAISGASLTNLPGGGKVLQVVSSSVSNSTAVASSSYVDVTGATATITPSATSSKILVLVDTTGYVSNYAYNCNHKLLRGSTDISISYTHINHLGNWSQQGININHLDSPSTTSATTYKVQALRQNTGTWNINPGSTNGMTMTLIEIGA